MKQKRYSAEQIIQILKEAEAGNTGFLTPVFTPGAGSTAG